MFRRVLIANRGEIACRIGTTLREMGITSIAVRSAADRDAMHVRQADECVEIGPAEARDSYLNIAALLDAARRSGAEAIHPGYGFLSENAEFASAVESAGLTFIGPSPASIRAMGDKRAARDLAVEAGVPVVPGATGANAAALRSAARAMGFPVMVKAAMGGGGKGMRAVSDENALVEAVESAQRLAASAFGDASVYLEKRLERARHVEVQVLGDGDGNAIHFFERECSLQRRHQKVIEETPSPAIDEPTRERLLAAALALVKRVRYRGAGTVEFLLAPDGAFYFLEMNTRLQVEHPVTELATGHDLVRAQLRVAAEGRLPIPQEAVRRNGCAIEARVYAEDAAHGFLPQAGRALGVRWPRAPFARVDAGIEGGDSVSVHYDPLLAKIVAFGATRERALGRLASALDDARVHGVVTNLPFLRALARSPAVAAGSFDTEWIEREFLGDFESLVRAPAPGLALAAAAIAEAEGRGAANREGAGDGAARARVPDAFESAGRWRQRGLES